MTSLTFLLWYLVQDDKGFEYKKKSRNIIVCIIIPILAVVCYSCYHIYQVLIPLLVTVLVWWPSHVRNEHDINHEGGHPKRTSRRGLGNADTNATYCSIFSPALTVYCFHGKFHKRHYPIVTFSGQYFPRAKQSESQSCREQSTGFLTH